jgi:hypothetical protein
MTGLSNISLQNYENYVLASELVTIADIHIANVNVLIKRYNMVEDYDYIKFRSVTLLRKNANWPPNFKAIINSGKLTNLKYLVPLAQFTEILGKANLFDFKEVKIQDKRFIDCSSNLDLFTKTPFIFTEKELPDYKNYKYISLKKKKYLGFY